MWEPEFLRSQILEEDRKGLEAEAVPKHSKLSESSPNPESIQVRQDAENLQFLNLRTDRGKAASLHTAKEEKEQRTITGLCEPR